MDYKKSFNDLLQAWKESPEPSLKITSYFPVYADLFRHFRGRDCVFIETGVLDGGSLFMWREWLGPKARIIGVDLNPAAAKWRERGFEIYIGDQGDPDFWDKLFNQIGHFDILLDDGGHQSFQQIVTVQKAIQHTQKPCLVVVEDTATSFMKDFSAHGKHSFLEYSKDATDCLVGRSKDLYPGRFEAAVSEANTKLFSKVYSIQFFDQLVAFHVNPSRILRPELVRNQPSKKSHDFRYEGKDEAEVIWPSLYEAKKVLVKGGSN